MKVKSHKAAGVLTKENSLISAATLLGKQKGVSTTRAFESIKESRKSKQDSR